MTLSKKKNMVAKILLVATFLVFIATNSKATSQINPKANTVPKNATDVVKKTAVDSIIADREVEIDLQKLSRMATLHARGSVKNPPQSGLVVVEVGIDTNGVPYSFIPREVSDDAFGTPAIDAIRMYSKRFKIKPAIKDGKPVNSPNTLIPIVFDMTIFDKK